MAQGPGEAVLALTAIASSALNPQGLAISGWVFLTGVVALAGLVRGFSGFGTALVLMPLASTVLSPVSALGMLTLLELAGPLVLVRRAWAEAERPVLARMALGMVAGLVPGVLLMVLLPVVGVRWLVSAVALVAVGVLVTGWRWRGPRGGVVQGGVGMVSGFLGGLTGLSGPPVVLFFLASPLGPSVVRANLILYLLAVDLALVVALGWQGVIGAGLLIASALMMPVFVAANWIGAWMFRALPGSQEAYRPVALVLMALAALVGLPLWE